MKELITHQDDKFAVVRCYLAVPLPYEIAYVTKHKMHVSLWLLREKRFAIHRISFDFSQCTEN